jgi:hypothetical protein
VQRIVELFHTADGQSALQREIEGATVQLTKARFGTEPGYLLALDIDQTVVSFHISTVGQVWRIDDSKRTLRYVSANDDEIKLVDETISRLR